LTEGVHKLRVAVRWGHCDPAGIVYFPRFFEMFHEAMESWFGERLGAPYDDVIVNRKIGFPSVHTEADFRRPTRFGEEVVIELRVGELGRTSIRLVYRVLGPDGDERATGATVCAVMDLDPARATYRTAIPLPDDLRAAIEAFSGR
jgi:YbgC/YbaW family acyl-CoA thioester hydrolase